MTKTTKTVSTTPTATLPAAMRKSMLQIWQAGLGAFSRAQNEGGDAFAKLVQDGAQLEKRSRDMACAGASELAQSARKITGEAGKQMSDSWRTAETRLEKGISDALRTLGVPVRRDLHALIERIERLSVTIEALAEQQSAVTKLAVRKKNAADPAASIKEKNKAAKISPKALAKRAADSVPTRP